MKNNAFNLLKQDYQNQSMSKEQVSEMKKTIKNAKSTKQAAISNVWKIAISFAVVIAVFVAIPNVSSYAAETMASIPVIGKLVKVVTFRTYQTESERHNADVEIPEIVVADMTEEIPDAKEDTREKHAQTADQEEQLTKTAEEINAKIVAIIDPFIEDFKADMSEEGYQNLIIKHETIHSNQKYFTLKLICYQGGGTGTEWDSYFTIDLDTGKEIALKDLFKDNTDYLSLISDNIKEQMRDQMAKDEMLTYWVDYTDVPEWNFETITEDTDFYINEAGKLVISFDEGEVAPMYMGVVTFEIPEKVVSTLLK